MNLTSLEYVIEADRCGSISQAAKNLFIAQPNLSKAIRDLENEFDIVIFKRTPKGIFATVEGQQFIRRAQKILNDINDLKAGKPDTQSDNVYLSLIAPQSAYISSAFAEFISTLEPGSLGSVKFKECNSSKVIDKILSSEYDIGVIRCDVKIEEYFYSVLEANDLEHEDLFQFKRSILTSAESFLAGCGIISEHDLEGCIELISDDNHLPRDNYPDLALENIKNLKHSERIYIHERGSQLDLLNTVKNSYMWSDPVPEILLKRYGLVNAECSLPSKYMKDILVYKSEHKKTTSEDNFIKTVKHITSQLK